MDENYWLKKWNENDIRFNQSEPNPHLRKFFSNVPQGKVMVPLCGKSVDLIWLRAQGHEVVGIELSELACESFFKENGLTFQKQPQANAVLYRSEGVEIWCGDFFKIPASAWQGCNLLYDRAALIALPPEVRKQYYECLRTLFGTQANPQMLLITIDYDQTAVDGPPFSVTEEEIQKNLSHSFSIKKLVSEPDSRPSTRLVELKVIENVFWLTSIPGIKL